RQRRQASSGRARSGAARGRWRAARAGAALGGSARRPALSASLWSSAPRRRPAHGAAASRGRRALLSRMGVILSALAGLIAYAAVAVAVALAVPRLISAGAPTAEWIGIACGLVTFLIGLLLQEIFQRRAQMAETRRRLAELTSLATRLASDLRDFSVGRTPGHLPAQDLAALTAEMKIMKSLVAQLSGQAELASERPGVRPALSALAKPFRDPTEPFIGPPGARALASPTLGPAKRGPAAPPIAPAEREPGAAGPVGPLGLSDDDRLLDVMRD